jgi:hypothetical protein
MPKPLVASTGEIPDSVWTISKPISYTKLPVTKLLLLRLLGLALSEKQIPQVVEKPRKG